MQGKLAQLIEKSIVFFYFALAIVTPLLFTTRTTELYEVPKMFFIYFAANLILFLTFAKFIIRQKIQIPKNPIFIALGILWLSQIISTLTSIDKYTSIFGFPSRLNGGVLSLFAYLIIFACTLVNLSKIDAKKILMTIAVSALAISLWGIPGHFNRDPSCLILTGNLTSGCWQKEFNPKERIFSTLGQPNWLASYLVLVLPISLALIIYLKANFQKIFFASASVIIFWAIILTNSRSGLLGLGIALILLTLLIGKNAIFKNLKFLMPTLVVFGLIILIFRTGILSRTKESLPPITQLPNSLRPRSEASYPTTQLSTPTDSSQIRLIVWRGAFDIFKKWPIFGTGPETFVSSYYFVRPLAHNQTSEWEFYYNKAHNEFLNYLANTGIVGFASYISFVLVTIFVIWKHSRVILESRSVHMNVMIESPDSSRHALRGSNNSRIFAKAALAGFLAYQATIFFGFSTVVTQTTMFLILASTLKISQINSSDKIKLSLSKTYQTSLLLVTPVIGLFALTFVLKLTLADIFQKRAENNSGENFSKVLTPYQNAQKASPAKNPYLLSDFSYSLATSANSLQNSEAFQSRARDMAKDAIKLAPANFLVLEKSTKSYIALSSQSANYYPETENIAQRLTSVAPTYPPAYLTKAKAEIVFGKENEARKDLQKALELKPDYLDAQELLQQLK